MKLEFTNLAESENFMANGLTPQARIDRWELMMTAIDRFQEHLTAGLTRALADDGVDIQTIRRVEGNDCAVTATVEDETKH